MPRLFNNRYELSAIAVKVPVQVWLLNDFLVDSTKEKGKVMERLETGLGSVVDTRHGQALPTLATAEIDRLRRFGKRWFYADGERLFAPGGPGHGMFVVLKGTVAVTRLDEASVPGVFAIGDLRAGSVKRVGAAISEGAAAVAQLHAHLAAQIEFLRHHARSDEGS